MPHKNRTEFVVQSSTHEYASMSMSNSSRIDDVEAAAASFAELAQGKTPVGNPVYARLHNETVSEFEQAMAAVEGTEAAVAFSSGMAAVTAAAFAANGHGSHIIAIRPLYGGTDHLLCDGMTGLTVRFADVEDVADMVNEETAMIVAETPANPTLDLVDVERLCAAAGDVPVLIDNTFATPVLQNPAALGAQLVLHSASKYIGGHGDVIGGVIATTEEWAQSLRQVRIATGGLLHPMAGYLLRRGLSTLPVRVEAAQKSAVLLANRLCEHQAVNRVYYPGLSACDPDGIVEKQMRGPGAMIAFEVKDADIAGPVMEKVEVIMPAVSLGSTDSLIQHPASLTHCLVDEEAREACGVSAGLLRLSVGLEHVDDLWRDLDQALS